MTRGHGGEGAALGILLFVTFVAGGIGTAAALRAPEIYQALAKPPWAPPPGVFGPVWTVLYILMAVAAWLIVRARGWRDARLALLLYGLQLASNAIWTWLFFAWHSGQLAFLDIIALLVLVAATAWTFWRVRPLAAALLVPYLTWVAFASALTWAVWKLNPQVL